MSSRGFDTKDERLESDRRYEQPDFRLLMPRANPVRGHILDRL